jgi:transposase-like protein
MNALKDPTTRTRRHYDPTFKREAVQNWLASGKTAEVVARELGIEPGRLFTWRRLLFGPSAPAKATPSSVSSPDDLRAQLEAAHREIRHLKEQRDILKKTLGILSEPPPSASSGLRP